MQVSLAKTIYSPGTTLALHHYQTKFIRNRKICQDVILKKGGLSNALIDNGFQAASTAGDRPPPVRGVPEEVADHLFFYAAPDAKYRTIRRERAVEPIGRERTR